MDFLRIFKNSKDDNEFYLFSEQSKNVKEDSYFFLTGNIFDLLLYMGLISISFFSIGLLVPLLGIIGTSFVLCLYSTILFASSIVVHDYLKNKRIQYFKANLTQEQLEEYNQFITKCKQIRSRF